MGTGRYLSWTIVALSAPGIPRAPRAGDEGEGTLAEASRPEAHRVIPLPRTRRLSMAAMVLEAAHQVLLALWTGSLVFAASLAVPAILAGVPDAGQAVRLSLEMLGRLGLLGCGTGSVLLLTTLLMHLLTLRDPRTILGQVILILLMTAIATWQQVYLAPRAWELLRAAPELAVASAPAELQQIRSLLGTYLALLLAQAMLGLALMLAGLRRWYRYVPAPGVRHDFFWP
jgi:hypothetical protein